MGAFYARYNGNLGHPKNKKSCFFHLICFISNKCSSFVPWHSNLFSKVRSGCYLQIFKDSRFACASLILSNRGDISITLHNVQFVKYDVTVSFMAQVLDTVTYLVPQVLDTAS